MTGTTVETSSIVERDELAFKAKENFNISDLIVYAARKSGRSSFAIGREMIKYSFGAAGLKASEYVLYALYDRALHTDEERSAFISAEQHSKIVTECVDYGWFEVTSDKWLSSVFIGADGIPTPEILAMIDTSERAYQGVEKIETPQALKAFLRDQSYPLFCKFNNGIWSLGASIITGADQGHIHLRGKEPITYDAFFSEFIGDHVFMIQEFVENHSFLKKYTPTTATVRLVNMWTDDGLWTPHAILKLPASHNEADNFWREGNLACQLDVETGEILTVVGTDGFDLVRHDVHPETGAEILGQKLPHWQKVREMNDRAAALHYPVRYSSQDIAITEDGPVEIEFNMGSAFELPQIATGKGFMTPAVRAFFRSCGSTKL